MIRSVCAATAFVLAFSVCAAAQTAPKSMSFPVQVTGAPGTDVLFFVNDGKHAEMTIGAGGDVSSLIDLSNHGKQKVTLYVDVCQDGKIVKVMLVAGAPPPQDENCKKRIVAAPFLNDCGVTRLTIDVTKMFARVIGCGGTLTQPKVIGPIGGALVGGLLLTMKGGDSTPTSTFVAAPTPPVVTAPPVAPPTVTTPPTTSAPPTNNAPPPTTPTAPTVTANGTYACQACAATNDVSRHDGTLRLCNGLNVFTLVEGSLTIRHPAPFIEVTGTNYNTSTGAFDLTGRGAIAGFTNVSVRAVGTVNNTTGRVTFEYTMGTAGEFPGGQPITYTITLQKQ